MSEPNDQTPPVIGRRGLLFVLSSPSGAGKTTLANRLLTANAGLQMSVSVTTRPPRPGEIDGRDYRFVDVAAFNGMKERGELLEWAEVFGNLYGTPRAQVEEMLNAGLDVLFDIDWQGTRQLAAALPTDLVRVFILPPSAAALEARLTTRALDDAAVVRQRMAAAAGEIEHWDEYDYVLINAEIEDSVTNLKSILAAERMRRERQTGLRTFVVNLLSNG